MRQLFQKIKTYFKSFEPIVLVGLGVGLASFILWMMYALWGGTLVMIATYLVSLITLGIGFDVVNKSKKSKNEHQRTEGRHNGITIIAIPFIALIIGLIISSIKTSATIAN